MAILKIVNRSTKSKHALKKVLAYVLQEIKTKEGYVAITGPYAQDEITAEKVYREMIAEKNIWKKLTGRMYAHYVLSFHKDEIITPAQVLDIIKQFADRFFPDFQCLLGVHQDKDHLHGHTVINSVSFIDGHKIHQSKKDLENQKNYINLLCKERGLTIARKGFHFDGTPFEKGEISAWSKDKYNLLKKDMEKSFVADCAMALMQVIPNSTNRNEFITGMSEYGWTVNWKKNRKHIVFINEIGDKVRDTTITKTVSGLVVSKEVLENEFASEHAKQISKTRKSTEVSESNERTTKSFLTELKIKERASEEKQEDSVLERQSREAERRARNAERRRLDLEAKRRSREGKQKASGQQHCDKNGNRKKEINR